jgi:hypothetical protein
MRELITVGASLMPSSVLNERIAVDDCAWARFAAHWDDLAPDRYAADLGSQRFRRYSRFAYTPAAVPSCCEHESFVQPEGSNPLHIDTDRRSSR